MSLRAWRLLPRLAVVGVGLSVLAACGSNSASPSTGASMPTATPTPLRVALPPVQPDANWPSIVNGSGGALDDAQAQAVGTGLMRMQVLSAWAEQHHQVALLPHMMTAAFLLGDVGVAMAEGDSLQTPDCGVYPTELVVRAPDAALVQALAARNQPVHDGDVPVVLGFAGPCAITATTPSGETRQLETLPAARIVVLVHLVDDPVVGRVAYLDSGSGCSDPAVAALCGAAG